MSNRNIIKQIGIQNYQSQVDTVVNPHPGVNVFFGATNHGKSAILRVCRWILENRPIGNKHRTHNSSETFGTLVFSNNNTITRRQTNTKNQYILSGVEKSLDTIRTDVPEAVMRRHNIGSDNFQVQKDSYFLLDQSPGKRAKKLNELAGLSQIDAAIKEVNSRIRTRKQTRKITAKEIENKKKQIKDLDWLNKAQQQLSQINKAQKKNDIRAVHINKILNNITVIQQLQQTKDNFIPDDMVIAANKILLYVEQRLEIAQSLHNINSIIQTLHLLHGRRSNIIDIDITEVANLVQEYQELRSRINTQYGLLEHIKSLFNKSNIKTKKIKQLRNEHQELLASSGRCPLCHGEFE